MLGVPRRRRAAHALVHQPEQLPMTRIEAARAHHRFAAAEPREVTEQRKAGRGVERREPAAVEDEALLKPQAKRAERVGDGGEVRKPPRARQIEDARALLDLVLDPPAGEAHRCPQYPSFLGQSGR